MDGSEADALHPRSREPGFAGRGGACWEHVGGVMPLGGARLPMILRSLVEKGVYGFSNHVFRYVRPLLTPKQFSSERNLKRQVYNFRWFGSSLFIFKVNKHFFSEWFTSIQRKVLRLCTALLNPHTAEFPGGLTDHVHSKRGHFKTGTATGPSLQKRRRCPSI